MSLDFSTLRKSVSRKPYTCGLCQQSIDKGTDYIRFSGKYDGCMFDDKFHIDCYALIGAYSRVYGVDEWDEWEVHDWITEDVCSDCPQRVEGKCTVSPYTCDIVLETLKCKETSHV